jgi:hypothetical protein
LCLLVVYTGGSDLEEDLEFFEDLANVGVQDLRDLALDVADDYKVFILEELRRFLG